ncbi:MAG: alanine--tRNA ligase [Deltaproteobacteria bacterium]|jgi:alanyl-tRNA synthetase|nr:alanine--tRNA ligase [Deltaproteobacteria bacterium]
MLSAEIRQKFLSFFETHGHRRVASSSLVPQDDPTLLFTNAGMVQFKRIFTGEEKRDYLRATTAQKCVRAGGKHNDLENVGYTARHHTFFEMMGNFSFGDYFKKKAINLAWELLTQEFGLPGDKLYATVYTDDDEAYRLWETEAGLPQSRISRLGEKDNFWAMGDTGPCGPCSEVLIDQGPELGCGSPDCAPGCDCDRYLEIWNLVFMQFERSKEGIMTPLPKPSIDTGLGLERLAAIKQNVHNNFESDLFVPLLNRISDLSGVQYIFGKKLDPLSPEYQTNVSLRVVADHARAVTFLVSDGVRPENLGRGYVLRRILRRAIRHGRKLGLTVPFMADMADSVIEGLKDAYPELIQGASYIKTMIKAEEERFRETLDGGLKLLTDAMEELKVLGESTLKGSLVFKLYDTFGFPVDLVADVAREHGFTVDEEGFNASMEEQKAKGRAAWKASSGDDETLALVNTLTANGFTTEFLGYETLEAQETPSLIIQDGKEITKATGTATPLTLIFASTPFYAASGGQETDTGQIVFPQGTFKVTQVTKAPGTGVFLHQGEILEGTITKERAKLQVDIDRRQKTANNHSATHLLHKALRKVLGDHVRQAGSSVTEDRLRFDFTHFSPVTPDETLQIEDLVNADIRSDFEVQTTVMDIDEAVRSGAVALFEERYGEKVRVVSMGDSRELCGGTHTSRTGKIGLFIVLSEGSVSSGVRRLECLTGAFALEKFQDDRAILSELSGKLKASPQELSDRLDKLTRKAKDLEKEKGLASTSASFDPKALALQAVSHNGVKFLGSKVTADSPKTLRELADKIKDALGDSAIMCLAAENDGKAILLVTVGKSLEQRFQAGKIVGQIAPLVGGKGGGRADLAQAGGPNAAGIESALKKAQEITFGTGA